MSLETLFWASISLGILVVLTAWIMWIAWRSQRSERARRAQQLDAVHNARMRRERGD